MSDQIRTYAVDARSTDTFGRVLCGARNHQFVIDGPVQNGCPGEELTPPEVFLSGVASCGVELVQVLARQEDIRLGGVSVSIRGVIDRSRPARPDVSVFNSIELHFRLRGVAKDQGAHLIEAFKAR